MHACETAADASCLREIADASRYPEKYLRERSIVAVGSIFYLWQECTNFLKGILPSKFLT
jgi:hypothetical protein